jgi:hypothetical protein
MADDAFPGRGFHSSRPMTVSSRHGMKVPAGPVGVGEHPRGDEQQRPEQATFLTRRPIIQRSKHAPPAAPALGGATVSGR